MTLYLSQAVCSSCAVFSPLLLCAWTRPSMPVEWCQNENVWKCDCCPVICTLPRVCWLGDILRLLEGSNIAGYWMPQLAAWWKAGAWIIRQASCVNLLDWHFGFSPCLSLQGCAPNFRASWISVCTQERNGALGLMYAFVDRFKRCGWLPVLKQHKYEVCKYVCFRLFDWGFSTEGTISVKLFCLNEIVPLPLWGP